MPDDDFQLSAGQDRIHLYFLERKPESPDTVLFRADCTGNSVKRPSEQVGCAGRMELLVIREAQLLACRSNTIECHLSGLGIVGDEDEVVNIYGGDAVTS